MSNDPSQALRDLRDALRQCSPDVESLYFQLSTALQAVNCHPNSAPTEDISSIIKALDRLLESIQQILITSVLPTFLQSLDERTADLLDRFFVPPKTAQAETLTIGRTIALKSYLTLSALLSKKPDDVMVPVPSRHWTLETLQKLSDTHGIDEIYWAVWGGSSVEGETSKNGAMRMLQWEEAVKSILSIPGKVANAVGRWKEEGWSGDIPESLVPR